MSWMSIDASSSENAHSILYLYADIHYGKCHVLKLINGTQILPQEPVILQKESTNVQAMQL